MMKINFKTITGKKYELETDPSQTIMNIKEILQNNYKIPGSVSLLYKSKILDDSQTIGSIDLQENSFIVIYKGKIQAKKNTDDSANTNQQKADSITNSNIVSTDLPKTPPEKQSVNTEESNHIHSSPMKNLLISAKTNFADPPDFKDKVEQLKVLGYHEYDCENALRAALYQIELAADYLASGQIPDIPKPIYADETLDCLIKNCEEEDEEDGNYIRFKNLQFLKKSLRENPENFATLISQIEPYEPELVATIKRDPALFLYQLGLDPSKYDTDSVKKPTSQCDELMRQFSSEEKNAIHRIESNGFDTMTVIQVYIACDKNEELTNTCLISMKT